MPNDAATPDDPASAAASTAAPVDPVSAADSTATPTAPAKPAFDRVAWIRRGLLFLLACGVAYALEHGAQHLITGGDASSPALRSFFGLKEFYARAVSSGPRELVPRFTAIVHIDPERDATAEGLANNVCQQRDYLAALLPEIDAQEPSIVVIDKYFTRSGCTQAAPTAALRAAVEHLSLRRPVILGLLVDPRAATEAGRPVLVAPLSFNKSPDLHEGIVNLDADARRVPLGWTVRAPDGTEAWHNGIALETALTHEPKLFERAPRLKRLKDRRDNPFVSMIAEPQHTTLQAADLLCAAGSKATAFAAACAKAQRSANHPKDLRHRIVVVGETGRSLDRHETGVIGNVPGTVLQANYVEALLDARYFTPAPAWINYLTGFAFFVLLELALQNANPLVGMLRLAGLVAATFGLLSLTARYLGYHVDPVTVSVLLVAFKLIGLVSERISHFGRAQDAP